MSIYGDLKRAYALKGLTTAFEGFAGLAPNEHLPAEQYARNTQVMSRWLDHLRGNSPLDITDTLFKQMRRAQRRGDARRFNSQTVLLGLLVESNMAVDLATYSAFNRVGAARQEGS
ncbi:hypothetical protein HX875_27630 [Pseudomonas yamanorum]|jgi:hypothetical protein|uniref:Uncharacterized protein n=1 Tax=Pseudomonas yamanorum TaxID=515393 RepID=A0A7Y8EDH9_9PSED|nr:MULTISPECIES: hypothetical protein [Pseudomonas]MCS3420065.1 hypothetical protein [Pseudomonas sp. BIGb0558]MCS3438794.1 hypothetical protein [Pseudomonas sp. BIGb0450]NVZ84667.1 hypothetical protein [Pseudomonas yamanorum]NWD24487.1 hypothetical protein [Pseudomonas yamanorum]NWE12639.1 hypothetical protein [Pseudomonas yamanorum]